MSIPENPLNKSGSTTFRHILVAFKYAEDAFEVKEFNPQGVTIGDSLEGVGPNIVVINEFTDQRFSIPEAIWDFDFTPCIGVSTSSSVGKLVIADRFVPYNFVGYLQREVLSYLNKDASGAKNLMSLSHATFMLKTIFTLDQTEGDSLGDIRSPDTVRVNPFFFNIDSIESVPDAGSITPHTHILHVMGASNTTGLLRSFSSVFQMSITHKEDTIHTKLPRGTGTSSTLRFREQEDQTNNQKRKDRLDLSKPMMTLKDIFEGLEADLNQLKYTHQGQLQEWLEEINTSHVHKISASAKQTKEPSPKQLPISYKIDLDPLYNDYQIDNRNMPFEQPNVPQNETGIRVFPVRPGVHILDLISNIMLLSKQIGIDSIELIPKTFKVTITATRKRTNEVGYEINIKIRRYDIPRNGIIHGKTIDDNVVVDRGPGAAGDNALHFYINDPLEADVDIVAFKSHINYDSGDNMLEQQIEQPGTNIVYGDREQATAERDLTVPFFQSIYSGVRPMIGSYIIDGLESAQRAGNVFNLMDRYTYTQTTDYEIVILGNPFLLSDVNRNPKDVVSDVDGVVHYYPKPEVNPMYIRLTIFEKSQVDPTGGSGEENEDIPERFYYDGHYHVARVINKFGVIGGGRSFYQNLILKRGDTLV